MQANARKVQRRLVKSRSPAQKAADVVEHVLATGGDNYLDTAEHLYTWWQLALLDVYLVLFVGVFTVMSLVGAALWVLLKRGRSLIRTAKQKPKTL